MRQAGPRIKCPTCGREVGTYVPAGGDGTAVRPIKHQRLTPEELATHRAGKQATCPGSYALVEPWRLP